MLKFGRHRFRHENRLCGRLSQPKREMFWDYDAKTHSQCIDPNFQPKWESKQNVLIGEEFSEVENRRLNILNQIMGEAALEIFKMQRPYTIEMLEKTANTVRYFLEPETVTGSQLPKAKCLDQDGKVYEIESPATGGLNSARWGDVLYEEYDSNMPHMLAVGQYLTK